MSCVLCCHLLLLGSTRANGDLLADISFALILSSVLGGLQLLLLAAYLTLPDVARYGNLLSISSFLVRYPYFVHIFTSVMSFISLLFSLILCVILPQTRPELRYEADMIFQGFFIFVLAVTYLGLFLVQRNIQKIFLMTIKFCGNSEASSPTALLASISKQEKLHIQVSNLQQDDSEFFSCRKHFVS